ncbi:hypothetical protein Tco_0281544 [Tanacetum coccineum]
MITTQRSKTKDQLLHKKDSRSRQEASTINDQVFIQPPLSLSKIPSDSFHTCVRLFYTYIYSTKARYSCDTIRERERENDKSYAELEKKCNDALQDLDKNPLVLDMRAKIETLQGQVDRLHNEYSRLVLEEKKWVNYEQTLSVLCSKVEGLEYEKERLKSSKT